MAKPTNLLAAYLRELPLTSEQKVQVYLLHIASKVDGGWFAAVTARKIGEQLDIDSAREVEAAIRTGGWEEHMGHVGRQAARGYIARVSGEEAVPKTTQPKRPGFDALKATLLQVSAAPDAPPDDGADGEEYVAGAGKRAFFRTLDERLARGEKFDPASIAREFNLDLEDTLQKCDEWARSKEEAA